MIIYFTVLQYIVISADGLFLQPNYLNSLACTLDEETEDQGLAYYVKCLEEGDVPIDSANLQAMADLFCIQFMLHVHGDIPFSIMPLGLQIRQIIHLGQVTGNTFVLFEKGKYAV